MDCNAHSYWACTSSYLPPLGNTLSYLLLEGTSPGVVYIHGLCSVKTGRKSTKLQEYCLSKGISFLSFDLSGHGDSSGGFNQSNVSTWLADCHSSLSQLANGPSVLVGSSLGGWLMFLVAVRWPQLVHALVGVSVAPDFIPNLWDHMDSSEKRLLRSRGYHDMPSPYSTTPYRLTLQLFEDALHYRILTEDSVLCGVQCAVCLIHGGQDSVVPTSTAHAVARKLLHSKHVRVDVIESGDHRLSQEEDLEVLLSAIDEILCVKN